MYLLFSTFLNFFKSSNSRFLIIVYHSFSYNNRKVCLSSRLYPSLYSLLPILERFWLLSIIGCLSFFRVVSGSISLMILGFRCRILVTSFFVWYILFLYLLTTQECLCYLQFSVTLFLCKFRNFLCYSWILRCRSFLWGFLLLFYFCKSPSGFDSLNQMSSARDILYDFHESVFPVLWSIFECIPSSLFLILFPIYIFCKRHISMHIKKSSDHR